LEMPTIREAVEAVHTTLHTAYRAAIDASPRAGGAS
jgi:hypothetical protein